MRRKPRSREEIIRDLERVKQQVAPQDYAKASARLIDELKRTGERRRYAFT